MNRKRFFQPPAQPLDDAAAQAIRELQERGEWDNVAGKGKPLRTLEDLSNSAAMSAKLRRDANFYSPWQEVAKEIEGGLQKAATRVLNAHRHYEYSRKSGKCDAQCEQVWRAALADFEASLQPLNSLILKYNLLIPPQIPQLHKARLRAENELQKLGIGAQQSAPP